MLITPLTAFHKAAHSVVKTSRRLPEGAAVADGDDEADDFEGCRVRCRVPPSCRARKNKRKKIVIKPPCILPCADGPQTVRRQNGLRARFVVPHLRLFLCSLRHRVADEMKRRDVDGIRLPDLHSGLIILKQHSPVTFCNGEGDRCTRLQLLRYIVIGDATS